ncbi:hypothetical protein GALL_146710 [mine drainage metagenome]|uniref:Uncharacterized protein n=1 Tax=mine drainage metagenome TaxID=410659 RepID=A0A1J5SGH8_9ZZZZ
MQWLVRMSILLSGLILCAGEGRADSLQQTLSARASEDYVTNPLLNPALQGLSAWRTTIDPNYMLTKTSGADEWKADLDVMSIRSSNTSIIANGNFPTATLGWNRQDEKDKFDISTSYHVASTMMDIPSTTGLVSASSTSTSRSLSADWARELSQRITLTLNEAYKNVSFNGSGNNIILSSFYTQSSGLKLNYDLTEHTATFMNLSYVDFVTTGGGPVHIYNAWLGLDWKASEHLDWTLQGGPSRLEGATSGTGATTASTSLQGGTTMNYKGQLSALTLSANRQSTPNGLGGVILIDQARGNFSYDLSERSKTGLDLGWSKYDSLTVGLFRTAGAWLHYDINMFWGIKAYFNHNTYALAGSNPATSNMLGLSIAYTSF